MTPQTYATAAEARAAIRRGAHTRPTSGVAPGYVQTNLVMLPEAYARDFHTFCARNPKPCPLLEVTAPGSPAPAWSAPEADLRRDLPKYRVFRDGEIVDEPTEVVNLWRDDFVAFLLGCSFTFEAALVAAGYRLAHVEQGRNVPMYITNRDCVTAGPFAGPLVVSMRPFRADELADVAAISGRYPTMHGAPVHSGDPATLGIDDLARPPFGEPVALAADQVPVFWACGVTPQVAARKARIPLMITHSPGHMFITDRHHSELVGQEVETAG
jgi:uncharacterized protein YcsI (UPF0317 family)